VIRAVLVGLLLCSSAASAETETIALNGQTYTVEYGKPDRRGISLDHITVGNLHYDTCERWLAGSYIEVDCVTGREP
jgi:hypothetical protein